MLSPERQTTASQAPIICSPEAVVVRDHWMRRVGLLPQEDQRDNWPMRMGRILETPILTEIEYQDQLAIGERQRFVKHPVHAKIGATLDGVRIANDDRIEVIEAKVIGPHWHAETVGLDLGFLDHYAPQVAVQMACREAERGFLAVSIGTSDVVLYPLNITADYIAQVIDRLLWFQDCVDTMRPPSPLPPPPVLPEFWRTIDALCPPDGNNWVGPLIPHLEAWARTKPLWAEHEQAKADIKNTVPPDVGEVRFGAITVKRARNGALTTRQREAA